METKAPRIGVVVCIENEQHQLLLGRRGKEPNLGKWVIPGGKIEFGESWRQAAMREIKEETALVIEQFDEFDPIAFEYIKEDEHRIILIVGATAISGMPVAGSDLTELGWFDPDSLPADLSPVVAEMFNQLGQKQYS